MLPFVFQKVGSKGMVLISEQPGLDERPNVEPYLRHLDLLFGLSTRQTSATIEGCFNDEKLNVVKAKGNAMVSFAEIPDFYHNIPIAYVATETVKVVMPIQRVWEGKKHYYCKMRIPMLKWNFQ